MQVPPFGEKGDSPEDGADSGPGIRPLRALIIAPTPGRAEPFGAAAL